MHFFCFIIIITFSLKNNALDPLPLACFNPATTHKSKKQKKKGTCDHPRPLSQATLYPHHREKQQVRDTSKNCYQLLYPLIPIEKQFYI